MNRTVVFAAALLFVGMFSAGALAYCSEPSSEPWCLSDDDSFGNSDNFESCRWEAESFVDDTNDYVSCLEGEIEDMRNDQEEAVDLASEVIRRFNCGVESGEACW